MHIMKKTIFHFFTFDEPSHSVIHWSVCKHPKYVYCHSGYLRQWQITTSAHTENAAPRGIAGLWGHWPGRDCPSFLFDVGPRCEPTEVFPQLFGEGGAPCAEGFKCVLRWYCGRTSADDSLTYFPLLRSAHHGRWQILGNGPELFSSGRQEQGFRENLGLPADRKWVLGKLDAASSFASLPSNPI